MGLRYSIASSRRSGVFVTAVFLVAVAARAAEVDPAGPRGAVRSFYQAMEAGDAAAVRATLHAADEQEKALADAYAAQLTAFKAFADAVKNKYGAAGDALGRGLPVREQLAALAKADETVTGETATVRLPGQAKPLRLVKSEGRWRVSIADLAGVAPEHAAAEAAAIRDMAAAFNAVAGDIAADKLPAPQDAQRALQQKLQAVMFNTLQKRPPAPATTRATSGPVNAKP